MPISLLLAPYPSPFFAREESRLPPFSPEDGDDLSHVRLLPRGLGRDTMAGEKIVKPRVSNKMRFPTVM